MSSPRLVFPLEIRLWKKSKLRWNSRLFYFDELTFYWQGRKKKKVILLDAVVAVADSTECPNESMAGCGFFLEIERKNAKTNRTYVLCAVSQKHRKDAVQMLMSRCKRNATVPSPRTAPRSPRAAPAAMAAAAAPPSPSAWCESTILIGAPKVFCESMSMPLVRELPKTVRVQFLGGHEVCELKLSAPSKDDLRVSKRLAHRWVDSVLDQFNVELLQRQAANSSDYGQSLLLRESDAAKRVTTSTVAVDLNDMLKNLELLDEF